jgi:hypothetical protein
MDDKFAQQLTLEILRQVEERRFTQFRLLGNWQEYQLCQQSIISTKLVIKVLRQSASNLFKQYCKTVITGISDIYQLMAYTQLKEAEVFYNTELDTFGNMVDEYEDYLRHGNFLYAYTGGERF